jgi:hypothetical protein
MPRACSARALALSVCITTRYVTGKAWPWTPGVAARFASWIARFASWITIIARTKPVVIPSFGCRLANVRSIGFDEFLFGHRLGCLCFSITGPAQRRDLLFCQLAKLARLNIQRDPAVARALDLLHVMANLFKHAANLAVLALGKRDFIPRIVRFAHQPHLRRSGSDGMHEFRARLAADADSLAQFFNVFFLRQSRNFYQICFGNM